MMIKKNGRRERGAMKGPKANIELQPPRRINPTPFDLDFAELNHYRGLAAKVDKSSDGDTSGGRAGLESSGGQEGGRGGRARGLTCEGSGGVRALRGRLLTATAPPPWCKSEFFMIAFLYER